jgi:lysophospholipase L1-like esterase
VNATWLAPAALAVLFAMMGCGSSDAQTGPGGSPGSGGSGAAGGDSNGSASGGGGNEPPAEVHFIGRFDRSDGSGPRFAWPGSAIAARFEGTGISIDLADEGTNYFAVVIDGGAPSVIATQAGQTTYELAAGLGDGAHDVWIQKRTESFFGAVRFLGLTPAAGRALVPSPPPFDRRIEFVGDSITCGYGNADEAPCRFSPATEDGYMSYGAIAARNLNAASVNICYSGIGVLRDYGGSTEDQMPRKFERIFADDPASAWDFSTNPDVVVINLGTNDFATGDPGQAYVEAMNGFVEQVRGHYPDAFIVLAVGSMLGGEQLSAATAYLGQVLDAQTSAGDAKVRFVDLGQQNPDVDGVGCDWHPSVATDQKMAQRLELAIRRLTGW